ncbi:MAG TPA: DNA-binding response regulator [Cyanobacteria bacterium UBA8803]|nr:DNA-binding response regulator [Cyanobacteria bacterium UBA9273]HBL59563.1 DNA-binding response regulator [Cyanobacteria bacterium UBA8803]
MKKILMIEERADTQNLFIEGLAAQGFYLTCAENGRVGVQKAREQLPDVITCEITVSELNGYGVLRALRQDPATAIIPFIFVSAKASRSNIRKGMELGANDYLTKPCTLEELLRAITVQLEKQTVLQQWYAKQSRTVPKSPSMNRATFTAAPELILPSDSQLSEVFRFIEANYNQPIALNDVAQAVGYSPAYLTNLIRRQTGQTVQRWIIERRMAAARSLLLETDQVVTEIATQVGYHHVVHFFRQFRKIHGTTPQAWRNENRS